MASSHDSELNRAPSLVFLKRWGGPGTLRFQDNTCGISLLPYLTIDSQNRGSGLEYEPTPVRAFPQILASLPEDLDDFVRSGILGDVIDPALGGASAEGLVAKGDG